MILKYLRDIGFIINSVEIKWNEDRGIIRQRLNNSHKAADQYIDVSKDFDGSKEFNIDRRRDIYKNIYESDNFFFLNYDQGNRLKEIEIHLGVVIQIDDITFSSNMNINAIVKQIKMISPNFKKLEPGEYFFEDLKLLLADEKQMGGTYKKQRCGSSIYYRLGN